MGVVRLDKADDRDKYILFRDDYCLYVVHESAAKSMESGSPGGNLRKHAADIIIEVATGKVIKSRYTVPQS